MTTATEVVEGAVKSEEVQRCEVTWWDPLPGGGHSIAFQCNAPVTHLLISHDGANLHDVPHEVREDKVCERCLNAAMLLSCEEHHCPVVISWSAL